MVNKYNLESILNNEYIDCKSTLNLTSLDDRTSNVEYYLCEDKKLDVFDFDKIKNNIDKDSKSPDANKNEYNNFYSHIITKNVNFYKNNFKELKC